MKFFYSIFAVLLLAFNISLGESVVVFEQPTLEANNDKITTITQTSSDSQRYAHPPSVMYSSIDRSYKVDRQNRRKFLFDMSMCFSKSGAFALLAVVAIVKFYELFVATNTKCCELVSEKIYKDDTYVCKSSYCENSTVLIIWLIF